MQNWQKSYYTLNIIEKKLEKKFCLRMYSLEGEKLTL